MKLRGVRLMNVGRHHGWVAQDIPDGLTVIYGLNEAGKSTLLGAIRGVLFGRFTALEPKLTMAAGALGTLVVEDELGRAAFVERALDGKRSKTVQWTDGDGARGSGEERLRERLPELSGIEDRIYQSVFTFQLAELQSLTSAPGSLNALLSTAMLGQLSPLMLEAKFEERAKAIYNPNPRATNPPLTRVMAELRETERALRNRMDTPDGLAQLRQSLAASQSEIEMLTSSIKEAHERRQTLYKMGELLPHHQQMRRLEANLKENVAQAEIPASLESNIARGQALLGRLDEDLSRCSEETETLAAHGLGIRLQLSLEDGSEFLVKERLEQLSERSSLFRSLNQRASGARVAAQNVSQILDNAANLRNELWRNYGELTYRWRHGDTWAGATGLVDLHFNPFPASFAAFAGIEGGAEELRGLFSVPLAHRVQAEVTEWSDAWNRLSERVERSKQRAEDAKAQWVLQQSRIDGPRDEEEWSDRTSELSRAEGASARDSERVSRLQHGLDEAAQLTRSLVAIGDAVNRERDDSGDAGMTAIRRFVGLIGTVAFVALFALAVSLWTRGGTGQLAGLAAAFVALAAGLAVMRLKGTLNNVSRVRRANSGVDFRLEELRAQLRVVNDKAREAVQSMERVKIVPDGTGDINQTTLEWVRKAHMEDERQLRAEREDLHSAREALRSLRMAEETYQLRVGEHRQALQEQSDLWSKWQVWLEVHGGTESLTPRAFLREFDMWKNTSDCARQWMDLLSSASDGMKLVFDWLNEAKFALQPGEPLTAETNALTASVNFEETDMLWRNLVAQVDSISAGVTEVLTETETLRERHLELLQVERGQLEVARRTEALLVQRQQVYDEVQSAFTELGVQDEDEYATLRHKVRERTLLERELQSVRALLWGAAGGRETYEGWQERLDIASEPEINTMMAELDVHIQQLQKQRDAQIKLQGDLETQERQWQTASTTLDLQWKKAQLLDDRNQLADEWASLKVASEVLRLARERFERDKRPETLVYAGSLFREATNGRYTDLLARSIDCEESQLLAIDASGQAWNVDHLSRGTRELIYLALRMALIRDYTARGVQMPVILDDPFVNFDDLRFARTLSILANTAKHTQMVYLTCHREVFEAAQALEGVHCIELDAMAGDFAVKES